MNKCHYIYDKEQGKILIPGCWSVVNSNRMEDCNCHNAHPTFKQFEKQEYNEALKAKNKYILELEKEVNQKNRIIKRLLNKK